MKFLAASAVALAIMAGAVRAEGLTIGLIPAESNEEMVETFEPVRAYLEERLGDPVRVYTATDYTGIIEAMRKRRIDVAWYGPMSYYLAEREANAEAFVIGVRRGGTAKYRSIISVPAGSDARALEDLRGRTIALVDPASTSGGLMPAYMVKHATGLFAEEFFSHVIWAGTHDAAQLAVKNRTVDAAAGADVIYQRMVAAELISEETNRIIVVSDPLPGAPLAYRGDLEPETKAWLVEAFLDAHNHTDVSGLAEIAYFERAVPADYQVIREMVAELGLSDEQLLD